MPTSFNKFNAFVEHLAEGVHNLQSNTLKVLLTNAAPAATNAVRADLTSELATGNGYTAGGVTVTVSSSSQTSGTYKLVLADATLTASGGSIGPFRYVVLYNDTPTSPADPLIGWWDYGSSISQNVDDQPFQFDFDGTAGVLTLA